MLQEKYTIKLLTYNVFLRPPLIKTNEDDYKNERLKDILTRIDCYDVICFQELFQTGSFRKEKVIEAAISKGFLYWKDCDPPSFWSGPPVDSGLLVISKYPILKSQFESYKVGMLSDAASDKGFIYCKIQVRNEIFHLFTTHLQASYLDPDMLEERDLSIKTRIQQFRTLLQRIRKVLEKQAGNLQNQLVMLVGDLNMNALMKPYVVDSQASVLFNEQTDDKFNEYDTFMRIFQDSDIKAIDCGLHRYQRHPVTFGDGEQVLTDKLETDSKQRLDFIFILQLQKFQQQKSSSRSCTYFVEQDPKQPLNRQRKSSLNSSVRLKPIIQSTKIQEFKIKDREYTQLSDHYGVSIEIGIK